MEHNLKALLANLRPRETEELVADHVRKLERNDAAKVVTLHVDKRYAFNVVISRDHIENIVRGVKKAFGEDYGTTIQLLANHVASEREKALPHSIHYH